MTGSAIMSTFNFFSRTIIVNDSGSINTFLKRSDLDNLLNFLVFDLELAEERSIVTIHLVIVLWPSSLVIISISFNSMRFRDYSYDIFQ